jgi:hypothetical protein
MATVNTLRTLQSELSFKMGKVLYNIAGTKLTKTTAALR